MQNIPSVDLRDFLSGEPERKQKFVNEIGKAFEDIGFVALKGHFLEDQLVDELYGGKHESQFKILTKKPILPTDIETRRNKRSRSAKLRLIEKK